METSEPSDIDTLRARLTLFKGRYPEISEQIGVSYSMLSKFANGERGARPSFDFIQKLQNGLAALETEPQPEAANG